VNEAPEPPRRGPEGLGVPLASLLGTLAFAALLALLIVLVDPLREAVSAALRGDTADVRSSIHDLGAGGPVIVLLLCAVHAFLFYPAEIVDAAAGFAYGFVPGYLLVMAGWMLNAAFAYAIGRTLGHPLMHRWVGPDRFARVERMIARGGVPLLLAVRLVPIFPFSLACYAAGAVRVPGWRYAWTTFVGYTPITAIAVYLGSRLEDLHLTHPLVLAAAGVLVALLFALRWLTLHEPADEPAD
jgi:uncharacterized membrane protein YdjX (TVP38/TMEM64 family)